MLLRFLKNMLKLNSSLFEINFLKFFQFIRSRCDDNINVCLLNARSTSADVGGTLNKDDAILHKLGKSTLFFVFLESKQ